jgi:hypothetical protein
VAGILVLGLLDTPLDWFPHLLRRSIDDKPLYSQDYSGLTADLYTGLNWIRENTPADAVLVVNNHSLHPSGRDSKYFYYTAFAERRVVLESWDYTDETVDQGRFSLDRAHSPFPLRLALSDAVFTKGDRQAAETLERHWGARYLVADKIHGPASPRLARIATKLFSNPAVDVYAIGAPANPAPITSSCTSEQGAGIAAVLGHRPTIVAAEELRRSAQFVGFSGLRIERRSCRNFAVVLRELGSLPQAAAFKREAVAVGFHVQIECRSLPPRGGVNAVFGHRRTRAAAERLAARAGAVGFSGLDVQQDACGDWEVDLAGLKSSAERREFRAEAARVGFRVTFEPG